jgi:hypothetical protein
MELVIKNGTGAKAHTRPDPGKFFQTKFGMTLIQVATGAKYDPKRRIFRLQERRNISTLEELHHARPDTPRRPPAPPHSFTVETIRGADSSVSERRCLRISIG